MAIVKESAHDELEPRLQEQPSQEPIHVPSFPLLIGWLPQDLAQLEREGRRPLSFPKKPN